MKGLQRHWFLVGLVAVISAGLTIGATLPASDVARVGDLFGPRTNSFLVAIILLLMSFSLDSQRIATSLRRPGPVIFACLINYGLTPLLAGLLMGLQLLDDFALGLMVAASVPCTMAAASVWTRKAGGNDAVSLLVTMLTNGLCFVFTPLWLQTFASVEVEFDLWEMVRRLVYSALLPCVVGQLLRIVPSLRRLATDFRSLLGGLAQVFVLIIVFSAALLKAGPELGRLGSTITGPGALVVAVLSCAAVHLAALSAGWYGGKLLAFSREDRIAIAFSASQKTLPIGLLIATMFGGFVLFPMLIYHASQLFIDTWIAERMVTGSDQHA